MKDRWEDTERRTPHADGERARVRWPGFLGLGLAAAIFSFVLEESLVLSSSAPAVGWVGLLRVAVWSAPWLIALLMLVRRVVTGRKTPWLPFGVGVALPPLLLLALIHGPGLFERLGRRDFDADAWKAAAWTGEGRPPEDRIKMVDDLLASGVLKDKTRAEVLALLGPDDGPDGTGCLRAAPPGEAVYRLGPGRGTFSMGPDLLMIRLGRDGRVERCWIAVD